jgi:SAM-dependent methyltransferase
VSSEYLLGVGKSGAKRLEIVHSLYGEESQALLKKAGLVKGMTVIDIGCGTGLMTKWLAEQVGDAGHVIAMDNSQCQLDLTKEYIESNKIKNVSYLCRDINELLSSDLLNVDLIYSRLVLVHNHNPRNVLQRIKMGSKAGTIFVFEEPITSKSECIPYSESFNQHLKLYCGLGELAGLNYDFGNILVDLVLTLGFSISGIRESKNYFSDPAVKLIAYRRTTECAGKYLINDMIKDNELDILLKELKELSNNRITFISGVSMVQVWGFVNLSLSKYVLL